MNFYKNEEGDVIFAMTEKVFADRVKNVKDEERSKYTNIDEALDIWECIDFAKFFDTIYAEFGKGTYQVNVTTHQEMYIQEELFKDDVLVAIEGSCELKLEEENFYLTTIVDVKPYLFLRPEETYLTLDEWRERVNNNDKMEDNHRDAIHVLIDSINQSVEKEYIEKNIIHHMPVWDKVSAMLLPTGSSLNDELFS